MIKTELAGPDTLLGWLHGATVTQLLGTVARMRLAEAIGHGIADADVLARRYGIPPDRMRRLLRSLADLDLCEERRPGGFALTEAGGALHPDRPDSLHHTVLLLTDPVTQSSWAHLETSLRTGRAGCVEAFGMPIFDCLVERPELAASFHATMSLLTGRVAAEAARRFDFGRFERVADIGGGNGTLLREVLTRHPGVRGVLFDEPSVVAHARPVLAAADLLDRCELVGGNFFDEVPAGADLYVLKWILHDWDDDRAAIILRRCREAMPGRGRLLLVEWVLPDATAPGVPRDPALRDLTMQAIYGGKERTNRELRALLRRAGLAFAAPRPLPGFDRICLLEAVPG